MFKVYYPRWARIYDVPKLLFYAVLYLFIYVVRYLLINVALYLLIYAYFSLLCRRNKNPGNSMYLERSINTSHFGRFNYLNKLRFLFKIFHDFYCRQLMVLLCFLEPHSYELGRGVYRTTPGEKLVSLQG